MRPQEQHAYPIFSADWGADEELLLIDGAQIYGLGNWADIADHIGNRTKEDVEAHYVSVYIEGRDGTEAGDRRAEAVIREAEEEAKRTGGRVRPPPVGPNMDFSYHIDAEEFQQRKRRRIEDLRETQVSGRCALQWVSRSLTPSLAPLRNCRTSRSLPHKEQAASQQRRPSRSSVRPPLTRSWQASCPVGSSSRPSTSRKPRI